MNPTSKIYIAGHKGMVGSAIWRELLKQGYTNLIGKSHKELDLLDNFSVKKFFEEEKPEYVFIAAAKVGGILANNTYPADFIYQNLQIQNNIIHNAYLYKVKKLLFLGSSCIYPRDSLQPILEEYLLTGSLEKTNESYAVAKIAGIKMCEAYRKQYGCDFISAMPTNLYGPQDNYDNENSHVIPGLLRRFHDAKIQNKENVTCWGDGTALREFLYVDDLAKAAILLMNKYSDISHVNVGYGFDISIKDLTEKIKKVVKYQGDIVWDLSKPNGTPQKLLDSSKLMNLGFTPSIEIDQGLALAYEDFKKRYNEGFIK